MTPPPSPPEGPTGPRWVLHPTIVAGVFALDIALANKIEPAGFARSVLIAAGGGAALTLIGWAVTRDRWLGGLLALALVVASISLVPVFFLWRAVNEAFGPSAGLALLGLILLAALAVPVAQRLRVRRGARPIRGPATGALNNLATILLIVTVVFHVGPDVPGTVADLVRQREAVSVNPPDAELPDIYVLLFDGYPRADVLSRRLGIDNSAFLADLRDLGFDVAEESHSNYTFTPLTMVSFFQMKHLVDVEGVAELATAPDARGTQVNVLRNAFNTAPAFSALDAAGYEIVVAMPGYEHVALRGVADRLLDHGEMNDLERDVIKRTWLLDLLAPFMPGIFSDPPRDRVLHGFADIHALATEARDHPIFAWLHFPVPHLPLVLDAAGDPVVVAARQFDGESPEGFGMTDAEFAAAYASELTYLNAAILDAVRALQAADGPDPIIVVMSDHGYNSDLADLQARFGNLFAASTSGAPGLLADTTPVQVMALLLNRYLGTDFALAPDRFFVSQGGDRLLPLTEVDDPDGASP